MQITLSTLAEQFNRKGIDMDQLALLMDDIELFFQESKKCSRNRLNIELERLGWGIRIVEPRTYQSIRRLIKIINSGQNGLKMV
jgi:hypothetical protein